MARVRRLIRAGDGARGKLAVAKVVLSGRSGSPDGPPAPVEVPMKALDGDSIFVRPGTTDLDNATDYLTLGIHLPPPEIASQDLRRLAELGSNMGAALTGLGLAYPNAELLGVEPDPGNLAVAAANVARFGGRAKLHPGGDLGRELLARYRRRRQERARPGRSPCRGGRSSRRLGSRADHRQRPLGAVARRRVHRLRPRDDRGLRADCLRGTRIVARSRPVPSGRAPSVLRLRSRRVHRTA